MRKGYLAIFLVLMMAIGVASSAQAYDNMAEPAAALVVPFVVANNADTSTDAAYSLGTDTAIALGNMPFGPGTKAAASTVLWTFFDSVESAHLMDNVIPVTAGMIKGVLWSKMKGADFDNHVGYLVFAFPDLGSTSLVANAFLIDGDVNYAAFIPTLQLERGRDIYSSVAANPLWNNGANSEIFPTIAGALARIWVSPTRADNGILSGQTIYPRYSVTSLKGNLPNAPLLNTTSQMVFWKPFYGTGPSQFVIQYDTITEDNGSCTITITDELEVLDPFTDVSGEQPFPEGAYLISGWEDNGGISWTFIFGATQAGTIVEAQTSLTPHWTPAVVD